MLSDFKKFVLRGNVVDLAVAVVVGVAFTAMITAFVADLITPLIAAIFGKPDFSDLSFTVNHSTFKYGSFLNALLSFLIVATVVFFAVVVPLTALMRRLNLLPKRGARARDARVPGVPERHPGRGAPLRLLHLRGGAAGVVRSAVSRSAPSARARRAGGPPRSRRPRRPRRR